MKGFIVGLVTILCLSMATYGYAEKSKGIRITVTGDPNKIGAIGLSYTDSKGMHKHGRAKATYTGSGFKPGLKYSFGYRARKLSKDMPCGSKVLNKNSTVWLDITKTGCQPLVQ